MRRRIVDTHCMMMVVVLVGLLVQDAHAYLDPGTGSLIVQAVVGVFLAGSMTFKLWYYRFKDMIKGTTKTTDTEDSNDE